MEEWYTHFENYYNICKYDELAMIVVYFIDNSDFGDWLSKN